MNMSNGKSEAGNRKSPRTKEWIFSWAKIKIDLFDVLQVTHQNCPYPKNFISILNLNFLFISIVNTFRLHVATYIPTM